MCRAGSQTSGIPAGSRKNQEALTRRFGRPLRAGGRLARICIAEAVSWETLKVTRLNAGLTEPIITIDLCGRVRRVRRALDAPIDHSLNDGSRHWRAMESSPCLRLGQSERLLTCTTLHRAFPVPRDRLAPSTALSQYPTRHQCPPPDRTERPAGRKGQLRRTRRSGHEE